VAVIRAAGTLEQRVWRSRLDRVAADTAGLKLSPCIIVVGEVAAGAGAAAEPGPPGGGGGGGEG
jgi:uroporphyrinogen III methyltransferase/synthase